MNYKQQSKLFLDFLFEEEDIFEIRTKNVESGYVQSYSYCKDQQEAFINKHIAIHESNHKHIWVGVLPRVSRDVKDPTEGSMLWVDFNSSVTTIEQVMQSIGDSSLPNPSMTVFSGGGYHAYWKLDTAIKPERLSRYSRGVHKLLPTDNTFDPTRVMRVAGTYNPKRKAYSHIVTLDSDITYSWDSFPQAKYEKPQRVLKWSDVTFREMSPTDYQMFLNNWIPGRRNDVVLYGSGYLRKNLGYSEEQAVEFFNSLARDSGETPNYSTEAKVRNTYSKEKPEQVAGLRGLRDHAGIFPTQAEALQDFRINLVSKPKTAPPPVEIPTSSSVKTEKKKSPLNFVRSKKSRKQEFWFGPIVGPGLATLLVAEPKVGKSFAAMQMAYEISQGKGAWGMEVTENKRVLYLQAELSEAMVEERWDNSYGTDSRQDFDILAMTGKPDYPIDLVQTPNILYEAAEDYDVIIIDPVYSFFHGNESNGQEVGQFLNVIAKLLKDKKSVILVHHTRKLWSGLGKNRRVDLSDVRGANVWTAWADSTVLMSKLENTYTMNFTLRAARDIDDITLFRKADGSFTDNFMESAEGDTESEYDEGI